MMAVADTVAREGALVELSASALNMRARSPSRVTASRLR
jgi:hypothetical protein